MNLHSVSFTEYNHANWGFLRITQFQIGNPGELPAMHSIFKDLIELGLFAGGYASYSDDIDKYTKKQIGERFYAKYRVDRIEASDILELSFQLLSDRLTASIEEQSDYSVHFVDTESDTGTVRKISNDFLQTINPSSAAFFELAVQESDDKINPNLAYWDFFKCFIIYDAKQHRVYRIEMGRD